MKNKKAQIDLAIIKGLALALAVIGGFLIYEIIQATTTEGKIINCKWDCSNAKWGACIDGYSYRDINLCIPKSIGCLNTEPKPPNIMACD